MKKGLACRSHSSSCSEAGCSSVATLSGQFYKIYFFIASKSEKRKLNFDNKFSILEGKLENSKLPKFFIHP
jgi:hypothetical protein